MEVSRIEEWFGTVCRAYTRILAVDKPVVAALNGLAAGAGFQIALVSDLRVGHPGIRMGQPEINAGLPSVMGSYWMTLHLGWSKNQELSYTGRFMDCDECERLGLLTAVVEADRVLDKAKELAGELAAKAPVAFRRTKARFRELAMRGVRGGVPGGGRSASRRPTPRASPRRSWRASSTAAGPERLAPGHIGVEPTRTGREPGRLARKGRSLYP